MYNDDDFLQLSGIQHFLFCKRQWCLIHIEQMWKENYLTTSGTIFHERAHNESAHELRGNVLTVRGLRISSKELGISGQCDIVEFHRKESSSAIKLAGYKNTWEIVPVEYKRGKDKVIDADRYQVVAQAICLEEMFNTKIEKCYLYYGKTKRRELVNVIDFKLKVISAFQEMHILFNKGTTIKVAPSKACKACSLKDLRLPEKQQNSKITNYLSHLLSD